MNNFNKNYLISGVAAILFLLGCTPAGPLAELAKSYRAAEDPAAFEDPKPATDQMLSTDYRDDVFYAGESLSSGPVIYSYNGAEFQPDGQMFGGAFFEAAERPDWDNLDHLVADNGVYKLKMANEYHETQHVDFVRLLAIDHPSGSRIYPSFKGKLYTINKPQFPREAHDFYGNNVKKELRHDHGSYWMSNPYGRDLDKRGELRDGLILEFDGPEGLPMAALVLEVQNTMWASGAMYNLLRLAGQDLPRWYEQLNNSRDARGQVMDFLVREMMLQVSVWDGTRWYPMGHIWPVGPAASKDLVVELNLESFHEFPLKVKLEGPTGVWMVHSAEIDYSYYNIPSNVQELELQKATDQSGRNVLPMLQKADNRYLDMPETSNTVNLEFPAPPLQKGMERSIIVSAGGYYTIHVPEYEESQPGLLYEVLTRPGLFTRMQLEQLYERSGERLWIVE